MSATHRDCLRVTNAKGCMKTTRLENVLLVRFLGPVMLPPLIISTSLTFSQPPALSLYNDRQIFTPPNQKCNLGVSIGLESNVAVEFTEYGGYLCQRKAVPSCLGLSPSRPLPPSGYLHLRPILLLLFLLVAPVASLSLLCL